MQNHPLMILGTRTFLDSQANLTVIGSTTSASQALLQLEQHAADIIIFELSILGPYDFSCLEELQTRFPDTPILAYSYHEEIIFARRALQAGASGYLMKEAPPARLTEAVHQILHGGIFLTDRVKRRIRREANQRGMRRRDIELNGSIVNSLSNRELQVFQLLGDGFARDRIGQFLNITPHALSSTFYRMRRKLSLETMTELIRCALHWVYYEGDFS